MVVKRKVCEWSLDWRIKPGKCCVTTYRIMVSPTTSTLIQKQAYEAEKLNRSLCFCRLPSNYDKTTSTQTLFSVFSHVVKVSGVASHLPAHWQLVIHVYFSFQAAPPVALPQKKCCCDEENALASVTALELKLFAPTQPPKSFFGHLSTRTTVTWSCLSAVCASCWRSCRLQRRIYLNG